MKIQVRGDQRRLIAPLPPKDGECFFFILASCAKDSSPLSRASLTLSSHFKTSACAWLYCCSALFCQAITSIIEERKLDKSSRIIVMVNYD
ncbi:hypothetical protein IQ223_23720 [Microcystis aeruginosa LEGE 00239]|uniref:hypothetical protein n=1 Tax=Microcystis aeruginosa TaxID=1126 RepID=UPI00187E411E|nr:hypothetical protein [Microcystis aeruginosa]MBE9247356.1 hypothetical protein [Microcystis aeruginosa LEGE 00239]